MGGCSTKFGRSIRRNDPYAYLSEIENARRGENGGLVVTKMLKFVTIGFCFACVFFIGIQWEKAKKHYHQWARCPVIQSEPFNKSFISIYQEIGKFCGPNMIPYIFVSGAIFEQSKVVENVDHGATLLKECSQKYSTGKFKEKLR